MSQRYIIQLLLGNIFYESIRRGYSDIFGFTYITSSDTLFARILSILLI